MIRAFLSGEEIPGLPIPPAARAQITRQVLSQMSRAAEAASQGLKHLPDGTPVTKLLPPLSALPPETIKEVLGGRRLPQLSDDETRFIRDYYTARFVKERSAAPDPAAAPPAAVPSPVADSAINQAVDKGPPSLPPSLFPAPSYGEG